MEVYSEISEINAMLVFSGVVGRTQIYLGDVEIELLDRESRATGASRSELVRRAVRRSLGEPSASERLRALMASAGSWSGRTTTGAEHVDAVRGDLHERLDGGGLA